MNTNESNSEELVNSMGTVYGVSELTVKDHPYEKNGKKGQVLVTENSLVFLAWEFETGK